MYIQKDKERQPIHITLADIDRAYKNVEEFKKLVDTGKTPEQIFKDMLKVIETKSK